MTIYGEKLDKLYKQITGFSPYGFQIQVAEILASGQNIFLQAPTGSGKTWASLMPFIYAWQEWKEGRQKSEGFPRKLIYSLPLRALANSLYETVSNNIFIKKLGINTTLQTGEYSNDVYFEGDIIFTTIDQTLSNILGIPLSLPKKLSNVNAGAIVSSYLVFDEFHLLDPKRSLNTVITLMRLLREITPFCLMTATLSNTFLSEASDYLGAKLIAIEKKDYAQFSYVKKNAEKHINVLKHEMSINDILEKHRLKSIVILNTVERCVNLFKQALNMKKRGKIQSEIICIHSRFFQVDRKEKEERIKKLFSKRSSSVTFNSVPTFKR